MTFTHLYTHLDLWPLTLRVFIGKKWYKRETQDKRSGVDGLEWCRSWAERWNGVSYPVHILWDRGNHAVRTVLLAPGPLASLSSIATSGLVLLEMAISGTEGFRPCELWAIVNLLPLSLLVLKSQKPKCRCSMSLISFSVSLSLSSIVDKLGLIYLFMWNAYVT